MVERTRLWLASLPPPPLIHDTGDNNVVKNQKPSQKPAVNTVQQSYSYKTLPIRLLYLYSKSGVTTMYERQCSTGKPQLLQYFKIVLCEIQNVQAKMC